MNYIDDRNKIFMGPIPKGSNSRFKRIFLVFFFFFIDQPLHLLIDYEKLPFQKT